MIMFDVRRTTHAAKPALDAVKGKQRHLSIVTSEGGLNVVHDFDILRAGFAAGVAGNATGDLGVVLEKQILSGINGRKIIPSSRRRSKW
jgi:hypothetical protein